MNEVTMYNCYFEPLDTESIVDYNYAKYIQIKDQETYNSLIKNLESFFEDEPGKFSIFKEMLPEGPGIWYWTDIYDKNVKMGYWMSSKDAPDLKGIVDLEEYMIDKSNALQDHRSRTYNCDIIDEW